MDNTREQSVPPACPATMINTVTIIKSSSSSSAAAAPRIWIVAHVRQPLLGPANIAVLSWLDCTISWIYLSSSESSTSSLTHAGPSPLVPPPWQCHSGLDRLCTLPRWSSIRFIFLPFWDLWKMSHILDCTVLILVKMMTGTVVYNMNGPPRYSWFFQIDLVDTSTFWLQAIIEM